MILDISRHIRQIAKGLVFRTSAGYINAHPAILTSYGIKTIIDMRTTEEIPDDDYIHRLLLQNITYHHYPIDIEQAKQLHTGTPMESVYQFLGSDGLPGFSEIVDRVIAAPKPILVHCRHGVDRTGVLITLLLLLLGVRWEIVYDEYLIAGSNVHRRHLSLFLNRLAHSGWEDRIICSRQREHIRKKLLIAPL